MHLSHLLENFVLNSVMSGTTFLAILLVILGSIFSLLLQILRGNGRKLPPGPWQLPIIGNLHLLTPLPHRGLQALATKYGPIMSMRLGRVPTVVVSSPQAAELILKTYDNVFASRPKVQASVYLSYGTKGMAFTEYGPYWRNVRKFCTLQLLTSSKVESFAALRREEVASVVASLRNAAAAGEVVDVSRKVGEIIANISCRTILGRNVGDERYDLKGLVEEVMRLTGAFNMADFVPYLAPLDLQGYKRQMKKVNKDMDKVFERIIAEHEQIGRWKQGHYDDFIDVLLSLMNQPMNSHDEHVFIIDRTNLKAILVDLMTAALDTSSALIEWALSELLKNPRVMKNVQEELESVVGTDKIIVDEKDLRNLVYLDMVVKESFRLHPVVPLLLPRESMKDITIEGYYIPNKSRIIINTWAIGRDPNVWSENVEEFYPERFINENNIDFRGRDFRLLPFGAGRRGCPGLQMGLTTIRLVLAQLVHCFNWELPSGTKPADIDMTEKFGLSVVRANHLLLKPIFRLHSETK